MKRDYRVPQTLQMKNGYRRYMNVASSTASSVRYSELITEDNYVDAKLTYPILSRPKHEPVVPQFVKYDKLCLCFSAMFIETVAVYSEEMNKRRQVRVVYFLEDDTMAVFEGRDRVVRRARHKKGTTSEYNYHWKDLNVGQEITLHGIQFYLFGCDKFTRSFLTSKGMQIGNCDLDSHLMSLEAPRKANSKSESRSSGKVDTLKRFLDLNGQVLGFDSEMEKSDGFQKEALKFKLYFFLEDETITIKELKENQEGRHRFPLYLRRTKIPKTGTSESATFLEAKDLRIGEIINVFGTKFLLLDCDQYTRDYFNQHLKQPQPPKVDVQPKILKKSPRPVLSKYLGLGTPEDSLSSTISLRPKAPVIGMPQNDEVLRYKCKLNGSIEDQRREFVLKFNVRHGTITITELPIDNSGIMQGRFVTSQRVAKPNCNPDFPEFYGPSDLLVGQVILINCHRFKITEADKCVEEFMQKYPEKFSHHRNIPSAF